MYDTHWMILEKKNHTLDSTITDRVKHKLAILICDTAKADNLASFLFILFLRMF